MKLKFLILAFLAGLTLQAQSPQQITLSAPPPPPVSSVNATPSAAGGTGTYFYWVVAVYPIGKSFPANPPAIAANVPSGATVSVNWSLVPFATSYDVLRTSTSTFPASGTCNCAVQTGVTAGPVTDTLGSLSSYTVSTTSAAQATISINNRDYPQPRTVLSPYGLQLPADGLFFADGTHQTTAGGGSAGIPGGASGQVQYNNAGAFGGFTVSQDATLNTASGALTVTGVQGAAIPLSAAFLGTNASRQLVPVTNGVISTGALTNLAMLAGAGAQSIQPTSITTDALLQSLNLPGFVATGGVTPPPLPAGVSAEVFLVQGSNFFGIGAPTALSQQFTMLVPNAFPSTNTFLLCPAPTSNVSQCVWGGFGGDFTFSGNNAVLANTAVTPGTYGDTSNVGTFTVDAHGRITAASNVAISGTSSCTAGKSCIVTNQTCNSGGFTVLASAHNQGANPFARLFSTGTINAVESDSATLASNGDLVFKCNGTVAVDAYISGISGVTPNYGGTFSSTTSIAVTQDQHNFVSVGLMVQLWDDATPRNAIGFDSLSINANTLTATIALSSPLSGKVIMARTN